MLICQLPGVRFLPFCHKKPKQHYTLTNVLMLISRVALGILAAVASPALFVPAFATGVAWGLYRHYHPPSVHGHHHHSDPAAAIGCGEFFQSIAGTEFPIEFSILTSLAVTVCHIDHHPFVFVPYCSIALALYVVKESIPQITRAVSWLA